MIQKRRRPSRDLSKLPKRRLAGIASPTAPTGKAAPIRRRTRRIAVWTLTSIASALIGAAVTINSDALKSWWSAREPLEVFVSVSKPDDFAMVVPDPARLPRNIGDINSCEALAAAATSAGGVIAWPISYRILLTGKAEEGVEIIDMKAVVVRRQRAVDGALLECPSAGSQEPIRLHFDLTGATPAPAHRADPNNSGAKLNQFQDGYTISVAKKEPVPLDVDATLPNDALWWHIEAVARVNGQNRTIVIDDNGKDFFSPGRRPDNEYREGHGAGVSDQEWGIDQAAVETETPEGRRTLRLGPAVFPMAPAMDIYRPSSLSSEGQDRWVRRDGRKILEFNPNGFPANPLPALGQRCIAGISDRGSPTWGDVSARTDATPTVESHVGQDFTHQIISYRCRPDTGPDVEYQLHTAQRPGSATRFSYASNQLADQDRSLADSLLHQVQIQDGA